MNDVKITDWAADTLGLALNLLNGGFVVEVQFRSARTGHRVLTASLAELESLGVEISDLPFDLLVAADQGRAYCSRCPVGSWGIELGSDDRKLRFWIFERSEDAESAQDPDS